MKKKFTSTPLTDEYLQSLQGMSEPQTNPFFYTRLKAKMEGARSPQSWNLPFRPSWVITALLFFLVINSFIVIKQLQTTGGPEIQKPSLQSFASAYDLSASSSY